MQPGAGRPQQGTFLEPPCRLVLDPDSDTVPWGADSPRLTSQAGTRGHRPDMQ